MPTAENTEAITGRVTRSRKRLTSIDGESSSRPGTPVNINLQTIPETNTPLKRITRRASLSSTPAPITPSKTKTTLDNVELSNTPGRRPTRRRSVNITSDIEDHASQPIVSKPTISVVKEEEPQLEVEISKDKPTRITRSSSKSPRDNETGAKKNSKQSNKKTNADESLEVINLDDSVEVLPSKANISHSKTPKVPIKREKDETPKKTQTQQIENESTPTKKPLKLSTPRKITTNKQISVIVEEPPNSDNSNQSSENIKERKRSSGVGFSTPTKSPKPIVSTEQSNSDKGSSKKSESAKNKKLNSKGDDKPEASSSHNDSRKINRSTILENTSPKNTTDTDVFIDSESDEEANSSKKQLNTSKKNASVQNLITSMKRNSLGGSPKKRQSLEKDIQKSPWKLELSKNSPQKKNNRPEQLKNVAFNDTADENTIKSVYPKTPGLTKSKSYILDSSKDGEQDSSFISKTVQAFEDENAKKSDKDIAVDGEEHEGLSTKTPYKLKLKSGQSSTPIQGSSSPKPNTTSEVEEQNEQPAKDNLQAEEEEEEEEGVFSFPKTWTQTVSVKVTESTKIDCIAPQKQEMRMAEAQFIDKSGSISSQSSKHKSNRQESDDSEADDDMREEDDEDYLDDDDEEEPIREKTIFLDDEAMEVPEGEESMDSEEREYLEQNEVAHYAESIGSQDSEEDDGYDDDEADEEDAAFIVSDTEVVHEELEDEDIDNLEAKCEKTSKQKIYKRIRKVSESSDEQSNHPPSKDDTDFCLLVDSSLEENKSHGDDVEFPTKKDKNNSAIKESNDKNMSRKSMANKSIEEKSTKDKSLKESSRLEEDNSDTEVSENEDKPKSASKTAPKKSRRSMSTFQSKADISGSDDDVLYSEDQELRNVLKSPSNKELVNSPKRKSITKPTLDESEDESCQNKSTKASRNSMNENKACNDDVSDTTKSPSKTPANRSRRMSTFQSKAVISESDDDSEDQVLKSPPKKELTKSPKRSSIANAVQNENEDESSQNKSTTASRNSMNKSKACNDDVSDTKMTESNTKSPSKTPANRSRRMSNFQSKSDISESDDDDSEDQVLKSPPKKELAKSPKRQSIANTVQNEREDESSQNKSTKASRNSMNKSKASDDVSVQEEASNTELAENGGNAKSPTQPPIRARRMSTFQSKPDVSESEDNSENQEEEELKSPAKKSPKRKSICNPAPEKSEDESNQNKSTKDSRKSIKRKSLARTSTEETEESKESPRKLNTSRKSLVRTSTEDAEDTEEQNKTIMSVESESEPEEEEEPLPVSATPKDASPGRTLNSSKKMKKSLGQEQEEQSNDKPAKPQRRESIAQEVIINENVSESSDLEDEEEGDDKTSAEITDDEMETSRNEANEAQFSDQEENVATDETMQDFLGEGDKPSKANSSRRKSVAVANESKLDETFQMDPKNSLSSSMHDSLHRSILRKSLNQSQLRREAIEANRNNIDEEGNASSSDSEEGESSEEEEVQINKKVVCEKGLSVSLNSIQIKKKKLKDAKAIRNSFTIGVSVRKNSSEDADSSCVKKFEETLSQNEVPSENEEASPSSSSSATESEQPILSEEEDLEKVKDVERVGPYNKSRKSMSSSFLQAPPQPPSDSDANQQKRIKRTSLYLQEEVASNSFVENLAEEKKKIKQQKRKSSSFCGVTAPADDEDAIHVSEPRSEKKLKKTSEESEEKEDKDNIHHILSRCDEIMEKANQAKREAKLNAKKVKVKKPKWEKKEEEAPPKEDNEVKIPLVSKKEIKRKEKLKKELAKAVKQSVAVLTKIVQPTTKADQKNVPEKPETNKISSSKRLETEFLESLVELSHPKKKKAKEMDTTPPSDKENSKKKSNKSKSKQTFEDVHEKPKPKIQTLETVCGTVIVEPSTPKKLRNQNGFRESPKTPVGFKIQDISSANNAKAAASQKSQKLAARKLLTASGSFVEEDLSSKPSNSKRKTRKRKLPKIEEPIYSLPKTQWTPSGVFVEEDLFSARPLANSTATQFLVTSLNNGKTNKSTSKVVSSTTLNSALSFKQNALRSNKVPRQDSREILHRKQRKAINKQF